MTKNVWYKKSFTTGGTKKGFSSKFKHCRDSLLRGYSRNFCSLLYIRGFWGCRRYKGGINYARGSTNNASLKTEDAEDGVDVKDALNKMRAKFEI